MQDFQNDQYQAPVAPQAPAAPQTPVAPQAPVAPGAPVAPQYPGAPVAPAAPAAKSPVDQAKEMAQKLTKNPKLLMIAGGALVGFIVLVVIIASIAGNGYKKALTTYLDAAFKGDTKKIEDTMPKEVWQFYYDEYELDEEFATVDEFIASCEEGYLEMYEEEIIDDDYGKFKKFDYEIKDAKKVTDTKLDKIAESIADTYDDIDEKDVKQAYKVEIKGDIVFEEDEIEVDGEFYAVKIGGNWYLMEGYDDYYYFVGTEFVDYCEF